MKKVILSADGDSIVYLVPDDVADNLEEYCLEFCSNWLRYSPDAEKYRKDGILCYTERDFIDYLNAYVFPECESKIVEKLCWTNLGDNLPERYKNYPYFNF